jgi:BlaI family transcriptional regulator, penicillinase repressor
MDRSAPPYDRLLRRRPRYDGIEKGDTVAMARLPSKQPTDGELEILKVLWETGPAGLGQIHAVLQERRGVAITTVATMLKMMLAKELVSREDGPRGYLWTAGVSRKAAVSGLLGKLLQHVFDGSARRLVAHLIEEGALDDRERDEILEILKTQKAKDKKSSPKKKATNP